MKKLFISVISLLTIFNYANAQNTFPKSGSVGIATIKPNASAILDIDTTGKGILIPRMTRAQRDAIPFPATSLLIFQTDNAPGFYYYNGNLWRLIFDPSQVYFKGSNMYVGSDPGTATGDSNTVVGNGLLFSTTSVSNTVVGDYAMAFNQTGSYNTVMGYRANYLNPAGYDNCAFGYEALMTSNTGGMNTAIGFKSLQTNDGSFNTALGAFTLYTSHTAIGNTAIGQAALGTTYDGSYNTAVGDGALHGNTNGNYNTALGFGSMLSNTTGSWNTVIGDSANVSGSNFSNATAIGYKATATASNQVKIGNAYVKTIGGVVNWSIVSDGRYKKNFKNNVPGLAFINELKPLTYNYDAASLEKKLHGNNESNISADEQKALDDKSKISYSGFVAQQVEEAAKKIGYDFSGVHTPENETDIYSLSYADFVVPLVKAVQELSKMNDDKDKLIAQLDERITKLENAATTNTGSHISNAQVNTCNQALLEQNNPNPFAVNTIINYRIPLSVHNAQLIITNANGSIVKQQSIDTRSTSLKLDAGSLSSGAYTYTLYCDGKTIKSRRMLVAK